MATRTCDDRASAGVSVLVDAHVEDNAVYYNPYAGLRQSVGKSSVEEGGFWKARGLGICRYVQSLLSPFPSRLDTSIEDMSGRSFCRTFRGSTGNSASDLVSPTISI